MCTNLSTTMCWQTRNSSPLNLQLRLPCFLVCGLVRHQKLSHAKQNSSLKGGLARSQGTWESFLGAQTTRCRRRAQFVSRRHRTSRAPFWSRIRADEKDSARRRVCICWERVVARARSSSKSMCVRAKGFAWASECQVRIRRQSARVKRPSYSHQLRDMCLDSQAYEWLFWHAGVKCVYFPVWMIALCHPEYNIILETTYQNRFEKSECAQNHQRSYGKVWVSIVRGDVN